MHLFTSGGTGKLRNLISRVLFLNVGLICLAQIAFAPPLEMGDFDLDGNVLRLKTPIILFHKETGRKLGVPNITYTPQAYPDYEIRSPDSYKYFMGNSLIREVKEAIKEAPETWQGPAWEALVYACGTAERARRTRIVTSRSTAPWVIFQAFKILHKAGFIAHMPDKKNFISVMYEDFYSMHEDPGERKGAVAVDGIEVLNAVPAGGGQHLYMFSDDNIDVFETVRLALSENVGRWPNVKVGLVFTGTRDAKIRPHALFLTQTGRTRGVLRSEIGGMLEKFYDSRILFPSLVAVNRGCEGLMRSAKKGGLPRTHIPKESRERVNTRK